MYPKKLRALVCTEPGEEILIYAQSLIKWIFPDPQDEKEKVRLTKSDPEQKVKVVESKGPGGH